jgi:aldose 1-epimerase
VQIDDAFTDLTCDGDGLARVVLSSPTTRRSVTVWLDRAYRYVMIFTGDTLGTVSRRRQGLAVEPMTCPPNAFATGEDVLRLEPGAAVTTRWGIVVEDW